MLLTSVRDSPCSDLLRRSSLGRVTTKLPSSSFAILMGSRDGVVQRALGARDGDIRPTTSILTPVGTVIGKRPIRDMTPPLPNVGEDFPTHAFLGSLSVSQKTGRG